jgi:hypothetical protein
MRTRLRPKHQLNLAFLTRPKLKKYRRARCACGASRPVLAADRMLIMEHPSRRLVLFLPARLPSRTACLAGWKR